MDSTSWASAAVSHLRNTLPAAVLGDRPTGVSGGAVMVLVLRAGAPGVSYGRGHVVPIHHRP